MSTILVMPFLRRDPDQVLMSGLVLAVAAVLYGLGIWWIRRLTSEDYWAEATLREPATPWRRRIDAIIERAGFRRRAGGWLATRLELGFGVAAVVVAAVAVAASAPETSGIDAWTVRLVGLAGVVIGMAWMVRIYRAGLVELAETDWRYRAGD